jgi:CUB/sushi domain-containing protein
MDHGRKRHQFVKVYYIITAAIQYNMMYILGIDCGQLPDIANGKVDIQPDTRLGSKATYTCNPGFILQGRSTRTCQADGSYDGQEPYCQPVSCGSLSDPTNGWVHVSPSSALLGAVAIYRCKLGYVLSHSNSRTCTTTGAWSGTAPTCNRKSHMMLS